MASGAILLQWRDRNWAEHGHYIYRSDTPMNPNNLPSPIGSVEQNITEYIDYDVIEGEAYYYRIAAYRNNDIMVSDEIQLVAEPLKHPGPQSFIGGDMSHGFFGEVSVNDFITGDELASRIGLTAGASFNSNTEWLKFALNDEIIFIPKKPLRNNLSWEAIYQAGAVYGSDDNGLYPTGTVRTQDSIVTIDGYDFKVTLLKGANADPFDYSSGHGNDKDYTHGSEWNKLFYYIHDGNHTTSSNTMASEGFSSGPWGNYSDSDLLVHNNFGDGTNSLVQETRGSDRTRRLVRGGLGVSYAETPPSSLTYGGWRPALRLVLSD